MGFENLLDHPINASGAVDIHGRTVPVEVEMMMLEAGLAGRAPTRCLSYHLAEARARRRAGRVGRAERRRGRIATTTALILGTVLGLCLGTVIGQAETIDGDRITIVDGDTIALPCDPARGLYPGCAERVRLAGIDAPETWHPRCDAERVAGLLRGHRIEITRIGRDRYGRTLAHLTSDGRGVDAAMIAEGRALPWPPGRAAWAARCRHWCPSAPRCEE